MSFSLEPYRGCKRPVFIDQNGVETFGSDETPTEEREAKWKRVKLGAASSSSSASSSSGGSSSSSSGGGGAAAGGRVEEETAIAKQQLVAHETRQYIKSELQKASEELAPIIALIANMEQPRDRNLRPKIMYEMTEKSAKSDPEVTDAVDVPVMVAMKQAQLRDAAATIRDGLCIMREEVATKGQFLERLRELRLRWRVTAPSRMQVRAQPTDEKLEVDCSYLSAGSSYPGGANGRSAGTPATEAVNARLTQCARQGDEEDEAEGVGGAGGAGRMGGGAGAATGNGRRAGDIVAELPPSCRLCTLEIELVEALVTYTDTDTGTGTGTSTTMGTSARPGGRRCVRRRTLAKHRVPLPEPPRAMRETALPWAPQASVHRQLQQSQHSLFCQEVFDAVRTEARYVRRAGGREGVRAGERERRMFVN